jgi:ClpP class serine protease
VAGGRVYTGQQAHQVGLVDQLGGLQVRWQVDHVSTGCRTRVDAEHAGCMCTLHLPQLH